MSLKERIENDFKDSLKKKDEIAVSALRMLKAAIQNKEIEKRGAKLQEAEVISIIVKQIQQHHDSIEQFTKGKRDDLVKRETIELEILKNYVPKQLSEEEIITVVKKIISEEKADGRPDFGKVMKAAMFQLSGKADGKLVSEIVKRLLNPDEKL